MTKRLTIAITGPKSSGKSAIYEKIADCLETKGYVVDRSKIFHETLIAGNEQHSIFLQTKLSKK